MAQRSNFWQGSRAAPRPGRLEKGKGADGHRNWKLTVAATNSFPSFVLPLPVLQASFSQQRGVCVHPNRLQPSTPAPCRRRPATINKQREAGLQLSKKVHRPPSLPTLIARASRPFSSIILELLSSNRLPRARNGSSRVFFLLPCLPFYTHQHSTAVDCLTGRPSFASPRMSNYNDTLPSNRLAGWDPVGTEVEQWSIFIGLHASSVVLLSTLCVLIWWSRVKRPPVVIMVCIPLPGSTFDLAARS